MHADLADHISLIAAPIYAAMLTPWLTAGQAIDAAKYEQMRNAAVYQALMLRKLVIETPYSD